MAAEKKPLWQKSQYANLVRYIPSGTYYARVRVKGKLTVKSPETDVISAGTLRLDDLVKSERQAAESRDSSTNGRMTGGQAMEKGAG